MNMLKNEENGKYKETIKNTLNYDRKILKRFVNFMNNPDEETAAVQAELDADRVRCDRAQIRADSQGLGRQAIVAGFDYTVASGTDLTYPSHRR